MFMKMVGCTLGVTLLLTSSASAIAVYEGFDYSGTALHLQNGGTGWSAGIPGTTDSEGGWIDGDGDFDHLSDDGVSLDSPAFPFTPTGGRLEGQSGEAWRRMDETFSLGDDGDVMFMSALIRKNSPDNESGEDLQIMFYYDSTGDSDRDIDDDRARFFITSDDAFAVQAGDDDTPEATSGTPGEFLHDTTYFIVMKIMAGSDVDQAWLNWYGPNDTVPTTEPTTWSLHNNNNNSSAILEFVMLKQGSNNDAAIDELRIGDTWADVAVPEPATGLLLALAGLAVIRRRRA